MDDGRWFAFLRAINTGDRRLTNEALLAPFGELGFTDVAAYQAAGNVTFRCDDPELVGERRIEDVLANAHGFEVPTFVRSAGEVAALVTAEPFTAKELASTAGKVQVTFLRGAPTPDQLTALHDLVPAEDRVVVLGREWFWLPVEGISTSQLPVGRVESMLGAMTMRTLGTVQRMAAKYA